MLAAGALATACAPAPLVGVGRPTDTPRQLTESERSTAETQAPPIAADFATRLARVGPDSFVSWGHAGGRYAATVYVTPAAKEAVLHPGPPFPAGTELALATVDRLTHAPGPTFFMVKDAGDGTAWRYGTRVTTDAASTALCARCHAEAQGDHVFGLPE